MSNQETKIQETVTNQEATVELLDDSNQESSSLESIFGIEGNEIPNSNFVAVIVLTCLCIMQFQV